MRAIFKILVIVTLSWGVGSCAAFRTTENFSLVNLKPGTPNYYEFIAVNYYLRREYRQAIFYYQEIINRFSDESERYDTELAWAEYEIAFCLYKLNESEEAYSQYKKVVSDYQDIGAVTLAGQRIRALEQEFPALVDIED